jgi:hypothetical protein
VVPEVDDKQKKENDTELGQVLLNFKEEPERTMTGNRLADFIIAVLAIFGMFFIAGLMSGGIKI